MFTATVTTGSPLCFLNQVTFHNHLDRYSLDLIVGKENLSFAVAKLMEARRKHDSRIRLEQCPELSFVPRPKIGRKNIKFDLNELNSVRESNKKHEESCLNSY